MKRNKLLSSLMLAGALMLSPAGAAELEQNKPNPDEPTATEMMRRYAGDALVGRGISFMSRVAGENSQTVAEGRIPGSIHHGLDYDTDYFDLAAGFGASAGSVVNRWVSGRYIQQYGTTLQSEEDYLGVYAYADVGVFDLHATILDAEARTWRRRYHSGSARGRHDTTNVLRLEILEDSIVNQTDPDHAEFTEPIAEVWLLGAEGSFGMWGINVEVGASVGFALDLTVYAETWDNSKDIRPGSRTAMYFPTAGGGARLGGDLSAYAYARAFLRVDLANTMQLDMGAEVRLMDVTLANKITAKDCRLVGAGDLIITPCSVKIVLRLKVYLPVEVQLGWNPCDWTVVWQWVEVCNVTVVDEEVRGATYPMFEFEI